jgi:hypothetical protein
MEFNNSGKCSCRSKLVVLSLLPTVAFTEIETMSPELVENLLNELADGKSIPIQNAELTVDDVEITPLGIPNPLKLRAIPNPASVYTNITYVVPVAGKINLGIYNALGTQLKVLVANVSQDAGSYTLHTDVSSLRKGIYYIRLTLRSDTKYMVKTIIQIKN